MVLWGFTAVAVVLLLAPFDFDRAKVPSLALPAYPKGEFDRTKLALIIEKRPLPTLVPVLLDLLHKVCVTSLQMNERSRIMFFR